MESYIFWDKLVELHEEYELDGLDKFVVIDMCGGTEIILNVSAIDLFDSDKVLYGLLGDDTEIIIDVDKISCIRYNPNWVEEDLFKKEV